MKNRFLGILLAVSILIGLLPVIPAEAAGLVDSGTCGANLTWTLDSDGLLTISGTGNMDSFDEISSPWCDYSESISQVDIGDGVTSIGYRAFTNCSNLIQVNIPEGLTRIESYSFDGCENLENINFPESIDQNC